MGWLHGGLVFVGYYGSILLTVLTALFLWTLPWKRLFAAASAGVLTLTLHFVLVGATAPELPFYFPLTSHRNAVRYAGLVPMVREGAEAASDDAAPSLRYFLREVRCVLPPDRPTPTGVFPLFYGIQSTCWEAVKANSVAIHNRVRIDVLEANGYDFGIFAKSHFQRHKIRSTVFRGIDVEESFRGETADAWDRDMTDRLFALMRSRREADTPFFGFAFYKSTHFSYEYPPGSGPFQPSREIAVMRAGGDDDPTPVLNDYRNAVHSVHELVGDLLDRVERSGLLENTIVVVTSDHGESFNDDGANYWGHTGNFTRFQTQVPLILYMPWEAPRRVSEVTSEVDIAPTLLQDGLGCARSVEDYSNGVNLFEPLPEGRPVVVAGYVNHGVIIGNDVYEVFPLYVARYTTPRRPGGGAIGAERVHAPGTRGDAAVLRTRDGSLGSDMAGPFSSRGTACAAAPPGPAGGRGAGPPASR